MSYTNMQPGTRPIDRRTCCFCLDLRAGSILAGVYTLLMSVMDLTFIIFFIVTSKNVDEEEMHGAETGMSAFSIFLWIGFSTAILWILFGILLLIGVCMSKRALLMPWLICTIILTALGGISIIITFITWQTSLATRADIARFVEFIIMITLNIYALWCVVTFYNNRMQLCETAPLVTTEYPEGMVLEPPPSYNNYNCVPEKV